jgi:hypothetical protein
MFRDVRIRSGPTGAGPEMHDLPEWVRRCVILGAGASWGFDDAIPDFERPPLTDRLLVGSSGRALLNQGRYADLRLTYHRYCMNSNLDPDSDKVDAEGFAGELGDRIDRYFAGDPRRLSRSEDADAQIAMRALGEFWFYLFELFQIDARRYAERRAEEPEDNYRLLARSFRDRPFSVITLNYDDLLEEAILREGYDYTYQGDAVRGAKRPKVRRSPL